MTLAHGAALGPYEIAATIGAGGMGEVYRARDTRLGRMVAIKVLPERFSSDPEWRKRFGHEAKSVSALSHPNICRLYDIGNHDGLDFLVMELCEGKTLADQLKRGALPLSRVLEYGSQIAAALENAHQRGIVHRDLKPANVMVTRDGVKLLDFGLACASETGITNPSGSTVTMPKLAEREGLCGTWQYIAPEVLEGARADARADLFAFGVVLYEMVTGTRPFSGSNKTGMMAAILEQEPRPIRECRPSTPDLLVHLIESCLAKDPEQRVQNAHDVGLELEWLLRSAKGPGSSVASHQARWTVLSALLVLVAFAAALFLLFRAVPGSGEEPDPRSSVVHSMIELTQSNPIAIGQMTPAIGFYSPTITLSHAGDVLVYVGYDGGTTSLFRRRLDRDEIEPIPGTEGAHYAFFSPDDSWIGFLTNDRILKVPAEGGSPVTIVTANSPVRARWLPDQRIFVGENQGLDLQIIGPDGQVEVVGLGSDYAKFNDVLPDGRTVLVTLRDRMSADFCRVALYDLESQQTDILFTGGYDVRFVSPGFLFFARGDDLKIVPFDLERRKITGPPVVVQSNVSTDSFFHQAQYAVSDGGVLAYVTGKNRSLGRIASIDRDGTSTYLSLPERAYGVFDVSREDRQLAVQVSDVTDYLLVFDIQRGEGRRIPAAGDIVSPRWTPDGDAVVVGLRTQDATFDLARLQVAGGGSAVRRHYSAPTMLFPTAVTDDRRNIFFNTADGIYLCDIAPDDRAMVRRLSGPHGYGADPSPDGRWFAYASSRTGRYEVWISATDPSDDRNLQISVDGGVEPVWCHGTGELFYRSGSNWYGVEISTSDPPAWTAPRLVWQTDFIDTPGISYDVSGDGQYLFVSKNESAVVTDHIHLIQNWVRIVSDMDGS